MHHLSPLHCGPAPSLLVAVGALLRPPELLSPMLNHHLGRRVEPLAGVGRDAPPRPAPPRPAPPRPARPAPVSQPRPAPRVPAPPSPPCPSPAPRVPASPSQSQPVPKSSREAIKRSWHGQSGDVGSCSFSGDGEDSAAPSPRGGSGGESFILFRCWLTGLW